MAIFNEIEAQRYARMLQRLFGIKGGAPVRQLAGEVITIFPLFSGVENRNLEGWESYGVAMSPTGGAGQSAATKLRNDPRSNVIAVIHGLIISAAAAAQNIAVLLNAPGSGIDFGTIQPTTNMRLDIRSRPTSALIASQTTNFGAVPTIEQWFFNLAANTPFQLIGDNVQEIPLMPGSELEVIDNSLAANMSVSYLWRERVLEDSEKNPIGQ